MPSASHAVNSMWMWGALLAYNLSAWLQELAALDTRHYDRAAHAVILTPLARWDGALPP